MRTFPQILHDDSNRITTRRIAVMLSLCKLATLAPAPPKSIASELVKCRVERRFVGSTFV
jgi:hypothetical protein